MRLRRCVKRTWKDLEPNPKARYNGLVRIGVDETSYRKGHTYLTVVINHDTNEVVWVHEGHGKTVFSKFFNELTEEQRASIELVSGDGARWIDDCIKEFIPHAERCVDPFHVSQWANETLDELRRQIWRELLREVRRLEKEAKKAQNPEAPTKSDIEAAKEEAKVVKNSAYALGKGRENLTESQAATLELVTSTHPRLQRAYALKEELRNILKFRNPDEAEKSLKKWFYRASHSRSEAVKKLAHKIRRHTPAILCTIRHGLSNARVEATNNKIKLLIRKAYGFQNIENLKAMILLFCSSVKIPLPNRGVTH